MIDDNWELIDGEVAHEIEVLNYSNQVNVIEALVRFMIYTYDVGENGCLGTPNSNVLREFHRTATLFLLKEPGQYRGSEVSVRKNDGTLVHSPPRHSEVSEHIEDFFKKIVERWPEWGAVQIGAYALWLINWVHPFKNGNGRSARAFCYACISLKLGFVLPGSPTVIDLIMQNREPYQDALKVADISFETAKEPDLGPMINFIEDMLIRQLSSVTPSAANATSSAS
jgi:Fic family protein